MHTSSPAGVIDKESARKEARVYTAEDAVQLLFPPPSHRRTYAASKTSGKSIMRTIYMAHTHTYEHLQKVNSVVDC